MKKRRRRSQVGRMSLDDGEDQVFKPPFISKNFGVSSERHRFSSVWTLELKPTSTKSFGVSTMEYNVSGHAGKVVHYIHRFSW